MRAPTVAYNNTNEGMIYQRGQRADYDGWAKATNDPSWGWDAVRRVFDKSVNYSAEFATDRLTSSSSTESSGSREGGGGGGDQTEGTCVFLYFSCVRACLLDASLP